MYNIYFLNKYYLRLLMKINNKTLNNYLNIIILINRKY